MTTLPLSDPDAPEVAPRRISRRATGADAVFVNGSRVVGASVLVITGGVGVFLAAQMVPTFATYGFDFFTVEKWNPAFDEIGIAGVCSRPRGSPTSARSSSPRRARPG